MNKRLSFKAFAIVSLLLLGAFMYAPKASAITISPLNFELSGNPGDKISNVLRIYNDQDVPIGVSVSAQNFTASDEEGRVKIDLDNTRENSYSFASWIKLSPEELVIEPKSFKAIEFTVSVPLNAEPGGHYASILAAVGAASETGATAISQRIGALLLLNVSGEIKEEMYLKEFSVPSYSEYGPVTLVSRFENTGSVHLKPRGFITITNIFNQEVGRFDLPQSNVLPGTIRRIETSWGQKYLFGRYQANLTTVYGSTNDPITSVVQFWVIPWKETAAVGFAGLIVLIFLIRRRRRIGLALKVLFGSETPKQR